MGSRAVAGLLTLADIQNPRSGREILQSRLARAGLNETDLFNASRRSSILAGYLELHIEQGPRLHKDGIDIGVVRAIVGICSYHLSFIGRADHAGTTPMTERLDASQGASSFILGVRRTILEQFPDCVANVGALQLYPGAFNIVPENAELSLEFRSSDTSTYQDLEQAMLELARSEAQRYGLELKINFQGRHTPTAMNPLAQRAIVQSAEHLRLKHIPLVSGAGHDAQSFSEICPTGMIFVPSQDGASHSSREFTRWEDCINGANVLLGATLRMAEGVTGRQ
jgi:N-carbamoyl-L-amino-acid hydrolase